SKNYDWLDQMGFVDYETTGASNSFSAVAAGTKTSDGNKQSRGMQFMLQDEIGRGTRENKGGALECYQNISYLLNGNYKTLEGSVSFMENTSKASQIKFYGDGKLIYASPNLSGGMQTAPFNISVDNINLLKIHVEVINPQGSTPGWGERSYPCIVDARLSKK
ncbi:MAG: NPCBM/NEW2 domain-containing protein, partial [Clostridia bacterium]|nr:NPCBM/NEW2 domain-containing protein [Clostridia bacterium]